MGTRQQGTVLWFNETKRYGFIARHSGKDVFVHAAGLSGRGYRTLKKGQRVSFLLGHDHRERLQAVEVEMIGEVEAFVECGPATGISAGEGISK